MTPARLSRGRPSTPRLPHRLRRPALVAAVVAVVAGAATTALAVPVAPTDADGTPKTRTGRLTEAGPLAEHGFPAWYRDSNGLRLEACVDLVDPLCQTLPDEIPIPDAPVSYPDNFPGEFFYQLAGATVSGPGLDLSIGMDLEGAWAAEEVVEGDQMVFGRIRVRDKAIADGTYRVVHPYGVDEFVAAGDGINYTQDIGTTPGAFGQALASRVGPFLRWDPAVAPAAPAGYVGDPGVEHRVVGSPYGTNFVSVSRQGPDGSWVEIGRTDLFSVQGRYAQNAGVDLTRTTYTVGADGTGHVDVYATSDADRSIQVEESGLGLVPTALEGDRGRYYGRYAVAAVPPGSQLTVTNVGDVPVARKKAPLVDVVTVTQATYDAASDTLTVRASSSDQDATPGALGVLGTPLVDGVATVSTPAPPPVVTVTSDKGGSAVASVQATGAGMGPVAPVAAAYASPTEAAPAQLVTLTGTGSTGAISSYAWRQVPATTNEDVEVTLPDGTTGTEPSTVEVPVTDANRVELAGADQAVATFHAPRGYEGPIAFELVATGPGGASLPVTVQVQVVPLAPSDPDDPTSPPAAPTAAAGADQSVVRGTAVTLDGSASTLVDTYRWTQVSGPTVALAGAATARPTFTFPAMPLPTSTTGPNPGYAVSSTPVVLALEVTGQGGQSVTDQVTVSPAPETLAIATAEYRAGREWRVGGTSNRPAGQRVAIVLGSALTGRVIGTATVDALGAWSFRGAGGTTPSGATTVSAVSAAGGSRTGFAFRNR